MAQEQLYSLTDLAGPRGLYAHQVSTVLALRGITPRRVGPSQLVTASQARVIAPDLDRLAEARATSPSARRRGLGGVPPKG